MLVFLLILCNSIAFCQSGYDREREAWRSLSGSNTVYVKTSDPYNDWKSAMFNNRFRRNIFYLIGYTGYIGTIACTAGAIAGEQDPETNPQMTTEEYRSQQATMALGALVIGLVFCSLGKARNNRIKELKIEGSRRGWIDYHF